MISNRWLIFIQWVIAFEWLTSGWGKFAKPDFMANIDKTLAAFAAKTPYGFYADFLNNIAIPNAALFGNMVRIGELLGALIIIVCGVLLFTQKRLSTTATGLAIVALLGLIFMNKNFYFAAGWSSPSTAGINILMGLIELILLLFYILNFQKLEKGK